MAAASSDAPIPFKVKIEGHDDDKIKQDLFRYVAGLTQGPSGFLTILNRICVLDRNGGYLSQNSVKKLMLHVLHDSESAVMLTELQLFGVLELPRLHREKNRSIGIFLRNLKAVMQKDQNWFLTNLFADEYLNFYAIIIQTVNRILINKKLNSFLITERFVARTIFSAVQMIMFPNLNTPFTKYMLYEQKKDANEQEMIFLGRNVFLRSAWSLFVTLMYSHKKRAIFPESEVQITIDNTYLAYSEILKYYFIKHRELNNPALQIEKPQRMTAEKVLNEYQNVLGAISFAMSCFYIYLFMFDHDRLFQGNNENFVFDAWLWPAFRHDLQRNRFDPTELAKINIFNTSVIAEDAKHLHSFRATRTFSTAMPWRMWNYNDPQDSSAIVKSESLLGLVILDISSLFGRYDSYLRDFSKSESVIKELKNRLFIKILDLKKILNEQISNYLEIQGNSDIPEFADRVNATTFEEWSLVPDGNRNQRWIKSSHENQTLFLRIDERVFQNMSQISNNAIDMNLIQYDASLKTQTRKMVALDMLKSDILIGQSLLRYFEQMYQKFFVEARRL